jgi:hypothetical protein
MKAKNSILLPSYRLSFKALQHAFGPKVDKYEVELLHHALTHIHKHGILIYQKGLKTLKLCDTRDLEEIWHAARFIYNRLIRLGMLCEFATKFLREVYFLIGDLDYEEEPEDLNILKQFDDVIKSMPKIFSNKFTETGIDGLEEIDNSFEQIYESLLIVYSYLIPRLKYVNSSGSKEMGEIALEIKRHFNHIVGHCNHHIDAFVKLLPYLEDKLRKLH